MPPAAKETVAASIDGAPRSREDGLGMTSSSDSQAGSDKERQNREDVIAIDPPPTTVEQEVNSTDTIRDEVGTVEDDAEDSSEELASGEGESDDSESSGPGQGDIIELDRVSFGSTRLGSPILVLETTSNWSSYC